MGRKRNEAWWLESRRAAELAEPGIREQAERRGLRLQCNLVSGGRTKFYHWIFRDSFGNALLHYWPSAAKWSTIDYSMSGHTDDPAEALEVAVEILTGVRREHRSETTSLFA